VDVELVSLSVVPGRLRWHVTSQPLDGAPDDVARRLAGLSRDGAGAPPGTVLHSTSWRSTGSGLVVTYALFPAPPAAAARPLELHLACGPGPLHPAPPLVEAACVAAHAVRHLADLASGRDPHVVRCARQRPAEWALLREQARLVHVDTDPQDEAAGVA
jgi:hypothetical protein